MVALLRYLATISRGQPWLFFFVFCFVFGFGGMHVKARVKSKEEKQNTPSLQAKQGLKLEPKGTNWFTLDVMICSRNGKGNL